MKTRNNKVYLIGMVFATVGIFLPWMVEGDIFSNWTPGIHIYPYFRDNGGLLILFLIIIGSILKYRPPKFIPKVKTWRIVFSFLLLPILAIYFYLFLLYRKIFGGGIGDPVLSIGFYFVLLGSLMIFNSTLLEYLREKQLKK